MGQSEGNFIEHSQRTHWHARLLGGVFEQGRGRPFSEQQSPFLGIGREHP